ncbi:unnamed protein product [Linum trigynum]|uniref:Transposase-associated domain-containing protein n=1 Tax=Linum trigynum TaxID=586398 RepID=A0AAV2E9W2_9ROSI
MDKSWMKKHRTSNEYKDGVQLFLDYAFQNASQGAKILYPCINFVNVYAQTCEDIRVKLICDGILRGYTTWVFHGEDLCSPQASDVATSSSPWANVLATEKLSTPIQSNPAMRADLAGLFRDVFHREDLVNNEPTCEQDGNVLEDSDEENDGDEVRDGLLSNTDGIEDLIKYANEELYSGCKTFSKLLFLMHLYHLKVHNDWTAKSFTMLLELLLQAFPEGISLTKSHYDAKKVVKKLGLDYVKIEACPNDYSLYWNSTKEVVSCYDFS